MDGEYYTVHTQIIVIIIYSVKYCSMHVLPFSHKDGVYKHDTDSTGHIEYQMVKKPNSDDVSTCAAAADSDTMHVQILNSAMIFSFMQVVSVALEPGDALLFHCHLAHYTPPNVTDQR